MFKEIVRSDLPEIQTCVCRQEQVLLKQSLTPDHILHFQLNPHKLFSIPNLQQNKTKNIITVKGLTPLPIQSYVAWNCLFDNGPKGIRTCLHWGNLSSRTRPSHHLSLVSTTWIPLFSYPDEFSNFIQRTEPIYLLESCVQHLLKLCWNGHSTVMMPVDAYNALHALNTESCLKEKLPPSTDTPHTLNYTDHGR